MRGYSDEEVDIFLDDVADEFERLFQENVELNDRIGRLEEQIAGHAQMKDALEKTLISAQLQSDEMKAHARKESELILQEAELKARAIVNESYSETQRVQQALIQLKHLEEDFRYKFRSLLEGHLKLLNEAPIVAAATETSAARAEATDESMPPLVVASPETATPAEAEAETGTAPEDEVPTEETEAEQSAAPVAPVAPTEQVARPAPASEAVQSSPQAASAEESTAETVAPAVGESAAETGTGETVSPEIPESDDTTGGFFFGQQPEDIDDTFVPPEDESRDESENARDFEW
jgi:cell division initiation protein